MARLVDAGWQMAKVCIRSFGIMGDQLIVGDPIKVRKKGLRGEGGVVGIWYPRKQLSMGLSEFGFWNWHYGDSSADREPAGRPRNMSARV
jgi:hypothetical protein